MPAKASFNDKPDEDIEPPVLSISGLSVTRDGTRILDKIAWEIHEGEHWTILGANGSGKTSLLSALTGYLTPSTGGIQVLGEVYGEANWAELRKQIGFVGSSIRQQIADEEPALQTVVSGKYAVLNYWGKVTKDDEAEAEAILRQIDCAHLAERKWEVLSQGERQRILIGRALMAHPRLLILDEPCAGLDPVARKHFLEFVNRLCASRQAPTVILVTHHVEEIVEEITHLLLLRAGRVLAAGTRREVLKSALFSTAFNEPVKLIQRGGKISLQVENPSKKKLFKGAKQPSA
jgi:iron complex transport system ATP-binding protein